MINATTEASKLKLVCTRCSQAWSITPLEPEIANNLRNSVVTLSHEQLTYCPNNKCRQAYILLINGVQLSLVVSAVGDDVVEKVTGSAIVKPTLELIG